MAGSNFKIILFDLETIPDMKEALKVWPRLSAYPGLTLKATITSIICAGWKEYNSKKTHCINAWDFPQWKKNINNDERVVKAIYEVLKDADCVITQNGKRFDWKYLQTRIMKYNLPPLPKIHHVDTVVLAKQNLYAFNNRLNTLGEYLVNEKKLDHEGWDLWVDVCNKDKKAMDKMERYCKQDVKLLEKVFEKLKPFAKLPNENIYSEDDCCPNCGSKNLKSNGWRYTQTKMYKRLICKDCHTWSRANVQDSSPRTY